MQTIVRSNDQREKTIMHDFSKLNIKVNEDLTLRTLSEAELQEFANKCFEPSERKHLEVYMDTFYEYPSANEYYVTRLKDKVANEQEAGVSYLLGIIYIRANWLGASEHMK